MTANRVTAARRSGGIKSSRISSEASMAETMRCGGCCSTIRWPYESTSVLGNWSPSTYAFSSGRDNTASGTVPCQVNNAVTTNRNKKLIQTVRENERGTIIGLKNHFHHESTKERNHEKEEK